MEHYRMIDRKEVSRFLSDFISFFRRIVLFVFSSLRRYALLAVLSFLLVCGAGAYIWYKQKPVYESQMVCEYTNLSKQVYGDMIYKLQLLIKTRSYDALAEALKMPKNEVQSIVGIDGKNMAGSELREDFTTDMTPLYITVRTTDRKIFKPVEQALLDYLNDASPFRGRRSEMERAVIAERKKFLRHDLAQADSIIFAYSAFLKKTHAVTDTAAGFSNINSLLAYKGQLEEKVLGQDWRLAEIKHSVEVLHGFMPPNYPARSGTKILWTSILLGLAAAAFTTVVANLLSGRKQPDEAAEEPLVDMEPSV